MSAADVRPYWPEVEWDKVLYDLPRGIVSHVAEHLPEIVVETAFTGIFVSVLVALAMNQMATLDAQRKAKPLQKVTLEDFEKSRNALTRLLADKIGYFAPNPLSDQNTPVGQAAYVKNALAELRLLRRDLMKPFADLDRKIYDTQRGFALMDTSPLGQVKTLVSNLEELTTQLIDFIHAAKHRPLKPSAEREGEYMRALNRHGEKLVELLSSVYELPEAEPAPIERERALTWWQSVLAAQSETDIQDPSGIVRGGFVKLVLGTSTISYRISGEPTPAEKYLRRRWQSVREHAFIRVLRDGGQAIWDDVKQMVRWLPLPGVSSPAAEDEVKRVEDLDNRLLFYALQHLAKHTPEALIGFKLRQNALTSTR